MQRKPWQQVHSHERPTGAVGPGLGQDALRGQAWVEGPSHPAPPLDGAGLVQLRVRVALSHVSGQTVHSDQPPLTGGATQAAVLQACEEAPTQGAPPLLGGGLVHERDWIPPPQAEEQPLHDDHPPASGSGVGTFDSAGGRRHSDTQDRKRGQAMISPTQPGRSRSRHAQMQMRALSTASDTSVLTAMELELDHHIARGSIACVAVGSQTHRRLNAPTPGCCVASAGRVGAKDIFPGTLLMAHTADDVLVTHELAYCHQEICACRASPAAVAGAPLGQHQQPIGKRMRHK